MKEIRRRLARVGDMITYNRKRFKDRDRHQTAELLCLGN